LGEKMKQLGMLVVVVGALIGSTAWGQQPLNLDAAVGRPLPALRRTSQPRMVASGRQ
jgi:hypothetical protein